MKHKHIQRTIMAPAAALPQSENHVSMDWKIHTNISCYDADAPTDNTPGLQTFNAGLRDVLENEPFGLNITEQQWLTPSQASPLHALWKRWLQDPTENTLLPAIKAEFERLIGCGPHPKKATIREAFAFWLLGNGEEADQTHSRLTGWFNDVHNTLRERLPLARPRNLPSPLLSMGYQTLGLISTLRTEYLTAEQIEQQWAQLKSESALGPWPLSFDLAYWSEGAHRLSEMGDINGSAHILVHQQNTTEALLRCVPPLKDKLENGMWFHHQGRLAYYQGLFPQALQQYCREYTLHKTGNAQDPTLTARLFRNIANVLTDMGFTETAGHLAEEALQLQQTHDDPEHYKTLGRLGEIYLRTGDYDKALTAYQQSHQQQLSLPHNQNGQTATYVAHTYVLKQQFDQAATWYDTAKNEISQQPDAPFSPYVIMGQMALAAHQRDKETLTKLWNRHHSELGKQRNVKVLPAAIAVLCAVQNNLVKPDVLHAHLEKLKKELYLYEALCVASEYFSQPADGQSFLNDLRNTLQLWQQSADEALQKLTANTPTPPTLGVNPKDVIVIIDKVLHNNQWTGLEPIFRYSHPLNLL
jgi:tetratricopeptide (TPR) repeat protein